PVVGTVESNRRWIAENMALAPAPEVEGGWESMFDEADASVSNENPLGGDVGGLSMLDDPAGGAEAGAMLSVDEDAAMEIDPGALEAVALDSADLGDESLDLGSVADLPDASLDGGFELDVLSDPMDAAMEPGLDSPPASQETSDLELPPMPEFNPDQREAG
ncbi:MAG: hypothetical protein AAGG01_14810, partial [Planctomycetota bacterium]